MRAARSPYRGVANIVRFNAPVYVTGALACALGLLAALLFPHPLAPVLGLSGALAALILTAGSLVASYLTYDRSRLYDWRSLDPHLPSPLACVAHVHTGLDETSSTLAAKLPQAALHVFDATDVTAQTEPSIARARRLVPLYPGTHTVGLAPLPLPERSVDLLFLPMAAHEVRDDAVRARWFAALARSVRAGGRIIVVEHLRDAANTIAFHVGVLHFLSRRTWHRTFAAAGLRLVTETAVTPLLAMFVLEPTDAAASPRTEVPR